MEERQKEFNGLVFDEDGIAGVLDDETGTSLKRLKEIVLDPDEKSDDSLPVAVHPALVRKLKLHQAEGIRFMYNCAFESIDRLDGDGSGCILARKTQWRDLCDFHPLLHNSSDYAETMKIARDQSQTCNLF